jgi:paraquat-inducible protein B
MGRKANPVVIGAFVVGAVALAILGTVYFASGRYFRTTLPAVIYFSASVNGLKPGAPVKFKGVEVGSVREIRLNLSPHEQAVENYRIPVIIELDKDKISRGGGRRALTRENLDRIVDQGLRAQLSTESLLTGVLYISLDLRPDTAATRVADPSVSYPEIPTVPRSLEEVQQGATRLVKKFQELDLEKLVATATETLDGLRRVLDAPETQALPVSVDRLLARLDAAASGIDRLATSANVSLIPQLTSTLGEARGTFQGLRASVAPGAPLAYRIDAALAQMTAAAAAIEGLASELERDPSSIVRGRYVAEDGVK